jgi:hypothetical protein
MSIYEAVVAAIEDQPWDSRRNDEDGWVGIPINGSRGAFMLAVQALEEQGQVVVYGLEPAVVPEERRVEAALLYTLVNRGMLLGNFELDLADGEVRFKASLDPNGAPLTKELLDPLLTVSAAMVDRYGAALQAVIEGTPALDALALAETGAG